MNILIYFIVASLFASTQVLGNVQEAEKYLREMCGESLLSKWRPIELLGGGYQSRVFRVCDKEDNCEYALKIASKKEATLSQKMGETGLAPKYFDSYPCGTKVALVLEKMDGDLSKLKNSIEKMAPLMPKVLDLFYRSMAEYGVCHNDIKPDNFFYKENDNKISLFLGDYGLAEKCTHLIGADSDNFAHKEFFEEELSFSLSEFTRAFFIEGTNLPYDEHVKLGDKFLDALNKAIIDDKRWKKYFNNGLTDIIDQDTASQYLTKDYRWLSKFKKKK